MLNICARAVLVVCLVCEMVGGAALFLGNGNQPVAQAFGDNQIDDTYQSQATNSISASLQGVADLGLKLPFQPGLEWEINAGWNWSNHQQDWNWYAIDFSPVDRTCLGEPVLAAAPGQVINVASNAPGHRVEIQHDVSPYHTLYVHLDTLVPFAEGDRVSYGTKLGTCGGYPNFAPHLHFQLIAGPRDIADGIIPVPIDGIMDQDRLRTEPNAKGEPIAKRGFFSTNTVDKPNNPFYTYLDQSPGPTTLSTPTTFTLHLRNTGTVIWYRDAATACNLYLGTGEPGRTDGYHAQDHPSPFYQPGAYGWLQNNRIVMTEANVAPGDIATFMFAANVPDMLGAVNEYWTPILEGPGCTTPQWLPSIGIYWQVNVFPFGYEYVDQSPGPFTITEATTFLVHLRNTGVHTWYRETPSDCNFHLATGEFGNVDGYRAQDHTSPFYQAGAYGWLNGQRIIMEETSVPPGGIGTFKYTASVPNVIGDINEYWTPVVEGSGCPISQWLPSIGLYWQATVAQPTPPPSTPRFSLFLPMAQR